MKELLNWLLFVAALGTVILAGSYLYQRTKQDTDERHKHTISAIRDHAQDVLAGTDLKVTLYQGHSSQCVLFLLTDKNNELYQGCFGAEGNEIVLYELKRI